MQIKFIHEVMNQFSDNFVRCTSFAGVAIRIAYKFSDSIPWLANKAIVAYTVDPAVHAVDTDDVVYDYSALLDATTEEQVKNLTVKTYLISELTRDKYVDIVHKNVVVSEHMKQLKNELDLLKEIDSI